VKALALLLVARVAYADDVDYTGIDRHDDSSKLGASLSYFNVRNNGQWARLDLSGQFVRPGGGGLYFSVPTAFESDSGGTTGMSFGGLEAGGIIAAPNGLVVHAGFVFPTAETNSNALLGSGFARTIDLAQVFPNAEIVRAGISYSWRRCQFFGRADFGVDVPISMDDASLNGVTNGHLVHVDFALGVDADHFTLTAESTNAVTFSGESVAYNAFTTAIRFRTGDARPYLAIVVPLDNQREEPYMAIVAGIDMRFTGPN
jgi:hypothetical protein